MNSPLTPRKDLPSTARRPTTKFYSINLRHYLPPAAPPLPRSKNKKRHLHVEKMPPRRLILSLATDSRRGPNSSQRPREETTEEGRCRPATAKAGGSDTNLFPTKMMRTAIG